MNKAYMLKLAWQMLAHPDALWVCLLCGKYIKDIALLFNKSRVTHLSPLWTGILNVANLLPQCTSISVGNGLENNIWTDNWIAMLGPLANLITGSLKEHYANMTVQEF